jgi:hypothetical protein
MVLLQRNGRTTLRDPIVRSGWPVTGLRRRPGRLFSAFSGAATLVGVIHLTQPLRPCTSRGHALAAVFGRVIWSLASELTGLPTAVAVLFPCGAGRMLEIAGVAGEAWRFLDGCGTSRGRSYQRL